MHEALYATLIFCLSHGVMSWKAGEQEGSPKWKEVVYHLNLYYPSAIILIITATMKFANYK